MGLEKLTQLWEIHRASEWPPEIGANEGELMTLDTVVSGCVTYFLESQDGLDGQRIDMLKDCLNDLDALFPELETEAVEYFTRVKTLGSLLLEEPQSQ